MKSFKCIGSFLLCLIIIICNVYDIYDVNAGTTTYSVNKCTDLSEVKNKMDEYVSFLTRYKKTNKKEAHWNAELRDKNSTSSFIEAIDKGDWEYGMTTECCLGRSAKKTHGHNKVVSGQPGCTSNIFAGSAQCLGFARYFSYLLYGSYPTIGLLETYGKKSSKAGQFKYSSGNNQSDGFTYYRNDIAYPGLQVGDFVRWEGTKYGTHAAIIYDIGKDGTMTVIDCNFGSDPCVVHKHVLWINKTDKFTEKTFKNCYESGKAYIARYITDGKIEKPTVYVTTDKVLNIGNNKAILYGSIDIKNAIASLVGIQIGTSKDTMTILGSDKVAKKNVSMFYDTEKYKMTLSPGTKYYYQAFADVQGVRYYGDVKSFTTTGTESQKVVKVETLEPEYINEYKAILNVSISAAGANMSKVGMLFGTSRDGMRILDEIDTSSNNTCYSFDTNYCGWWLDSGCLCYYQAYAVVDGQYYYGDLKTFYTEQHHESTPEPTLEPTPEPTQIISQPPVSVEPVNPKVEIQTGDVKDLTAESATLYGSIDVTDGTATKVGIYIGKDNNYLNCLGSDRPSKNKLNMWYNTAKYGYELKPSTTYYYQAFVVLDTGEEYRGEIRSFTTSAAASGEVTTGEVKDISATGATLYGSIDVKNGTAQYVGIYFGTSPDSMKILGSDAVKKNKLNMWYSCNKFGITLSPGTTYYYQAFVTVKGNDGQSYMARGEKKSFTTPNN